MDKVPFQTDLEDVFNDEKHFNAQNKLHLYYRNTSCIYSEILNNTNRLLVKLYKTSNKYPELGKQLENRENYLVFESEDLKILQHADALLSDPSKWNKNDDQECDDDTAKKNLQPLLRIGQIIRG